MDIDTLLKVMKTIPDSKLDQTFIGALNLTEEQQGVVTFVFWLCYMTEIDLESIIQAAWANSNKFFPKETNDAAEKMLIDRLKGYRSKDANISDVLVSIKNLSDRDRTTIKDFVDKNYNSKPIFAGVNSLPYFIDKIRVYESLFGKTNRTNLLWKINTIRNDLSHNKIDSLQYNGESLSLRSTKEKIIEDYFRTSAAPGDYTLHLQKPDPYNDVDLTSDFQVLQ